MGDPAMDTPISPLSAPEPAPRSAGRGPRRRKARPAPAAEASGSAPTFMGPVRAGVGYGLRAWRLLIPVLLVHLALAFTVVMPFQTRMAERLDQSAHAPALAGAPDAFDRLAGWEEGGLAHGLWTDAKRLEKSLLDSQKYTVFWLALIAWLFGALVNGGYLGTAREGGRPTVARWLFHGGTSFGRMLRIGLVFAIAYYLLATLVLVLWAQMASVSEAWSSSSATKWWAELWRNVAMVIGFLWLRVAADLARADLVRSGRRSAWLAFFRGLGHTVRHPVRTFGLAALIGVPAFGIVLGFGMILNTTTPTGVGGLLLGFVIIEAAVYVRLMARAAVLAGSDRLLDDLGCETA